MMEILSRWSFWFPVGIFRLIWYQFFVKKHVERKYRMGFETNGRDGAIEAAVRAQSDGGLVLC